MEDEREDCADAWQKARAYRYELDEIYKFYMPYRQSTNERAPEGGGPSEGQSRTNHLYDATGLAGGFNFAGQMVADWMPPFQDFFKIEAGPLIPMDQRPQINRVYAQLTETLHGMLPRVRITAHEVMADVFCGTGAMYLSSGTDRAPIRAQAVPINEVALEEGPFGEVENVYWKRKYKARHLERLWPKGKFSDELNKKIKDDRKAMIPITQSTRYDAQADRWFLRVYADDDKCDAIIWEEDFRTNPWVTPRFFKVPGESMGRGLAHLALPSVKSANKTRELALRAAAFALMGIWMRRNDGVFNPDTAVFKPLAMWTVASTGGPLGASLQRLPVPQDFDVTSIVMKDEREQINKLLLNDDLPELQDSVRSPTEIVNRLRKVAKAKGGAGSRLSLELVTATVQRGVDILEVRRLVSGNLNIDDILVKATITAPAAAAQRADKVQWAVDWMQIIVGLLGPQVLPQLAKIDNLLPDIGRWLGNDERYIPTPAEMTEFKQLVAHMVAGMQAQQAEAKAPPPQPGSAYVNGSAF